jgi:hypothetical protein
MPKSSQTISAVRRDYNEVKKLRNQLGKKARGKPKTSAVYKDYRTVNREYKKIGQHLGKLTGRKSRKGR